MPSGSRAFDLVFTSRFVDAEEAHRIGLLDRLTTADNLLEEAKELARQIAFWPPVAMQMSKRVLQHSLEASVEDQLQREIHAMVFARRAPHDVEEAAASFRKRRLPSGSGVLPTSPGNDSKEDQSAAPRVPAQPEGSQVD